MLVFSKSYFTKLSASKAESLSKSNDWEKEMPMFQDSLKNIEVDPFIDLKVNLEHIADTLDEWEVI